MRTLSSIALSSLLLSLVACNATPESHEEEAPVWDVLFDGSSLDAWRNFKAEAVGDNWQMIDGELVCVGGGSDLITRNQYADFIFEFDWKVTPNANSGVMYHVSEANNASYLSGPEYQVIDNVVIAEGDGDLRHSAAANYALHTPVADFTKPVGEWNHGVLEVNGTSVRHWLNGELVVQFMQWTPEWNTVVKASKFGAWATYGVSTSGHIVLQDHGNKVFYRNVRVRSL
jgi:hypothetical protein